MNIALISEGVTDRPIIDAVLHSYFAKNAKRFYPNLNPLLPKKNEPVGWLNVLKYCESEEFRGAFNFNDYVIIQIDSDVHAEKGFDVPNQKTVEILITAIKNKIIEKIGIEFYEIYKGSILFCICVDSIECWLLPFYASTKADKTKQSNCCNTVNKYFKKMDYTLNCNKSAGSYEYYVRVSKLLSNKTDFFRNYEFNKSLQVFVKEELGGKIKFSF